jgi:ElaB/YqjD/DUF883 family membrane-anchored ribosome-binding protein
MGGTNESFLEPARNFRAATALIRPVLLVTSSREASSWLNAEPLRPRSVMCTTKVLTQAGSSFMSSMSNRKTGNEARGGTGRPGHKASTNVEGMIADAQDKGKEALQAVREVGDNVVDAIDESLAKRPYTTLLLAIGIGFLFGATWRR